MITVNGRALGHYKNFSVRETGLAVPEAEPLYVPAISNGYAPDDFVIDDSLILNAPLYLFRGSPFQSVDRYKRELTVYNATWAPDGRVFAGDGYISIGTGVNINGSQSIELWWKYSAYTDDDILVSNSSGGILGGESLMLANSTTLRARINHSGKYYYCDKTVAADTWYHVVLTFDADTTTLKLYINAGTPVSTTGSAAYTRAVGNMEIGRRPAGGGVGYSKCRIGEERHYSKALSANEVTQNCLATQWRYPD